MSTRARSCASYTKGSPDAIALVEALLQVTSYPDTDIAAISFFFWHQLSHALVGKSSKKNTNGRTHEAEEQERARRHQIFRPAYVCLIQNIMGRKGVLFRFIFVK